MICKGDRVVVVNPLCEEYVDDDLNISTYFGVGSIGTAERQREDDRAWMVRFDEMPCYLFAMWETEVEKLEDVKAGGLMLLVEKGNGFGLVPLSQRVKYDQAEQAKLILRFLYTGISNRTFDEFASLIGVDSDKLSNICLDIFGIE